MAVTITVLNGNTRYTHRMKGTTAKINKLYESASHYLYNQNQAYQGVLFDSLTQQQKADMVHAQLIQVIKDLAKTYLINSAKDTAGISGETEFTDTTEIIDEV